MKERMLDRLLLLLNNDEYINDEPPGNKCWRPISYMTRDSSELGMVFYFPVLSFKIQYFSTNCDGYPLNNTWLDGILTDISGQWSLGNIYCSSLTIVSLVDRAFWKNRAGLFTVRSHTPTHPHGCVLIRTW